MSGITAVLCVRNEGAFLLDWLAHHYAIGIDHIVVLSNDCEDGTDTMLDHMARTGPLTHIRNDGPYDQGGVQFSGLKLADKCAAVREADWLLALDIDEFVNVHVGSRTLPALIAALPDATAITLTWRLFGNGGVVRYEDMPVPQQFTWAAPTVMYWPWRAAMFKTLYRNDKTYRNLGVHRPRNPRDDFINGARWFDGEGRELPQSFHTDKIFSAFGRSNYALAQLNHYALGAMESYVLKAARGRAVHSGDTLGMDYWVERNWAVEEDNSIHELTSQTAPRRALYGEDPRLAQLHADAVAWRKARFDTLMLDDASRSLFSRLLMTPPSRALPKRAAEFLMSYAHKAREAE